MTNWSTTASGGPRRTWSEWPLRAGLKAADLALRVPILRRLLLHRLGDFLGAALDANASDPETLEQVRWFGAHLTAFISRVAQERPAARRALLRFAATYCRDVHRRSVARRTGQPALATVVIDPTDRCNLRCAGCYADSRETGNDLPFELMVSIVEEAVGMGATLITISGGEPFLRERTDHAITRLAGRFPNQGFLVYTNGTLIDKQIAVRLGKLGNVFPAISIEGFQPETDARRGRGTFRRSRLARELLRREGVMTGFSATVTRNNAEVLASDRFLDQRIAEGDLFGWFFLLQPIGRAPRPDLMVTASQRLLLRAAIRRWRDAHRPIFLGDFWNDGPLVGGCLAGGRYYFHVYANGDISPCVFAPIVCGNVFDIFSGNTQYANLQDFVQRHPVFVAFREEQQKIRDRARPCPLIDHPAAFRRIATIEGCRPAANMPRGYLDGSIAEFIDVRAAELEIACATSSTKVKAGFPELVRLPLGHDSDNTQWVLTVPGL